MQCIGAIWNSLKSKDWCFTRHDHTRSLQHTACDLYWESGMHEDWGGAIPRRKPISKVASSYTEAELAKVDSRINLIKKQENSQTTKAHREGTEKPAAATSTTEYQANLILKSNNRTRIAKKRSNSWFSSSRITRTRSLSCRTWIRPKRLVRSAKSRRSWSPTWAIRRSWSFAKPLPWNNASIGLKNGKLALFFVHVEEV